MTPLFILSITGIGLGIGAFASMLGIGGGLLIVPTLTLLLHFPIKHAIAVSLIGVSATSLMAASNYLKAGLVDVELGITLESSTIFGALLGGIVSGHINSRILYLLFSILVLYSAYVMWAGKKVKEVKGKGYQHYKEGIGASFFAGVASALLGIGGGVLKVPIMNLLMNVPVRIAVATSSFMIGMTAVTGVFPYIERGEANFLTAAPIVVGTLIGAYIGSKLMRRVPTVILRKIFAILLLFVGLRMFLKGI